MGEQGSLLFKNNYQNNLFLQVYSTRSTNTPSKIICVETLKITSDHSLKAHVLWSQQISSENQRPRPESHVETLFEQTAFACMLCMCVCTHSQLWYIKDWDGVLNRSTTVSCSPQRKLHLWILNLVHVSNELNTFQVLL